MSKKIKNEVLSWFGNCFRNLMLCEILSNPRFEENPPNGQTYLIERPHTSKDCQKRVIMYENTIQEDIYCELTPRTATLSPLSARYRPNYQPSSGEVQRERMVPNIAIHRIVKFIFSTELESWNSLLGDKEKQCAQNFPTFKLADIGTQGVRVFFQVALSHVSKSCYLLCIKVFIEQFHVRIMKDVWIEKITHSRLTHASQFIIGK